MGDLLIQLQDVRREPLDDVADLVVSDHVTRATVAETRGFRASRALRVRDVVPLRVYAVRAFPLRHRPVGHFAFGPTSGTRKLRVPCPVHPDRVRAVEFPAYDTLGGAAHRVLQASTLEHPPQAVFGQELYETLSPIARAGLLNLFAKMSATRLPGGDSVLDSVESLYRIRGDRVFANVALGLRDMIKTAVSTNDFKPADASLHTPPPGFGHAGSFKSDDRYGNLQVTFFSSFDAPLRFKADIDIDDAAGLEHAFQVLGHWLTGGDTHPYDIHQILTYQGIDPSYVLAT